MKSPSKAKRKPTVKQLSDRIHRKKRSVENVALLLHREVEALRSERIALTGQFDEVRLKYVREAAAKEELDKVLEIISQIGLSDFTDGQVISALERRRALQR